MRLFVYGSLQQGECNYGQVSPWVVSVRPARAPGQLFLRPDGYPALCVAEHLGEGTRDYAADAQRTGPSAEGTVPGQLLELRLPDEALPRLDWFEGYVPGMASEYLRVLIPTSEGGAWTYVCLPEQTAGWLPIERWPVAGKATPAPYQGSLG